MTIIKLMMHLSENGIPLLKSAVSAGAFVEQEYAVLSMVLSAYL